MSRPDTLLRRVAREPLVHFALLGAVIFAAHRALAPAAPPEEEREIRLDSRYLDALVQREAVAGAEPDREAVAERWIRDEALAREASRLGLDRGDAILRRRLVQKMELWLEAHVELEEPSDEALRAEIAAHPERYREPSRVSFDHVFFGSARPDAEADARAALAAVSNDAADLGEPFLLGPRFARQTRAEIAERFGERFAAALESAELEVWSGPVPSAYGAHLVRVTERAEGGLPAFADLRPRARGEVLRAARRSAVREAERALIERYHVVREPG